MSRRRVIFGVAEWEESPVCNYAERMARALGEDGCDASILVTEPPGLRRTAVPAAPPQGVKLHRLPRTELDALSDTWLSLLRFLEENAPCVYLSNQDWTGACITPRLSNRVLALGVLHDDGAGDQQHCFRLGQWWNGVVAVDPVMRQRLMVEHQILAARLAPIHTALVAKDYASFFDRLDDDLKSGAFRRKRARVSTPPVETFETFGAKAVETAMAVVSSLPAWPDPIPARARTASAAHTPSRKFPPLRDYQIVLTVPTGRISGVDIFAINLARELIQRGYKAEILQTFPPDRIFDSLPLSTDVPVSRLELPDHPTWRERWRALRKYLDQRAHSIYIPNYDTRHSCIAPTLPGSIRVVGIAHSDDPHHYDHIVRLAHSWDGVIGVSRQITRTIEDLAPVLAPRLATIPYGVSVPEEFPNRSRSAGSRLRVVYAGRVVRYQKRTQDLIAVGRILRQREVPAEITVVGNGPDANLVIDGLSELALTRHLRWIGSLSNDRVLGLFAESDVFLLPSSFEGMPISLLEAMACGCVPVVTDSRSGTPEFVEDGVNGFVVPVGHVELMAARLEQLASDASLLDKMKRAAYETIRDGGYTTSQMASAYIEFLERVTSAPSPRIPGGIVRPPELGSLAAHMPRLPLPIRKTFWALQRAMGSGASTR